MWILNGINFLQVQNQNILKSAENKPAVDRTPIFDGLPNPFLHGEKNYLKEYITRGLKIIKEVPSSSAIREKFDTKINELKLIKMFLDSGYSANSIREFKKEIASLARQDFSEIEAKHAYYVKNLYQYENEYQKKNLNREKLCFLDSEGISVENLRTIHEMAEKIYEKSKSWNRTAEKSDILGYIKNAINDIKEYETFDMNATAKQMEFIKHLWFSFDADFINNLSDSDNLTQISLIADIKRCGSIDALQAELKERMKNKPVSAIEVDKEIVADFVNSAKFGYENLNNAMEDVDLTKYKNGLPLKYSRQKFISDFNSAIKDLKPQEKKAVFDYFGFNIDGKNDIIKYPMPNNAGISELPQNVQTAILKARIYVDSFVLKNEFILDEEDEKLQNVLNDFAKVFPEFLSVVGKIQHRGDSIDYHTLDDLKMCLNNPETKTLTKEEQEILFLSVMFHDIAKKESAIDDGHQLPSAYYAKEIIKKLPVSFSEKERIYNLILNSHWTTEGKSSEDLAAIFRHPNDFKMAQILAKADTISAGFEYAPDEKVIEETEANIKKIQTNGIILFADNLPVDKSKFPTKDGVMYLDFTDKEADLSQYGFHPGTKVKDLNLLCHSTYEKLDGILGVCDDSKEICLSASLLNAQHGLSTGYNYGCNVILDSANSDIAVGGVYTACTGGKRNFEHFKDYVYMRNTTNECEKYKAKRNEEQRKEIPDFLKKELGLSDEEYIEFFNKMEYFDSKKSVQDITLSTGRTIKADNIKEALNTLHNNMLNSKTGGDYINEVVTFQPKIQAVVMNKRCFLKPNDEDAKLLADAKANNIPIILV